MKLLSCKSFYSRLRGRRSKLVGLQAASRNRSVWSAISLFRSSGETPRIHLSLRAIDMPRLSIRWRGMQFKKPS